MKILISGCTGFVGSHLADLCLEKGHKVYGTTRWRSNKENIFHILMKKDPNFELVDCDVSDFLNVVNVISKIKPDIIFHLAAQSFVPSSWTSPTDTFVTNVLGTINVLESVRMVNKNIIIHIAGSSEEYGSVENIPIKETDPLNPISPYAVSKVTQDLLGYQYFKSYNMNIIRTRGFNHSGSRRNPDFFLSGVAKKVTEIYLDLSESIIKHGNLEAIRDFTHVKDMVRAYYELAVNPIYGSIFGYGEVFNICYGIGFTMKEALNLILKQAEERYGEKIDIKLEQDPTKMRPSDVPILIGDNSKLKEAIHWRPEFDLVDIINDLLYYWENKLTT